MTQITRLVVCTLRRPNVGLDEFGIRTKVLNAANGALLPLAEELGAALCLGEPTRKNPIAVSRIYEFLLDWRRVQLMDAYFQERFIASSSGRSSKPWQRLGSVQHFQGKPASS